MTNKSKDTDLWTPRSTKDTQKIYADWAATYEDDVTALSYATPDRVAQALIAQAPDLTVPVLDFGCGTGLSGVALRKAGFEQVDGTDISPQMLEQAAAKTFGDAPLYRRTWLGQVGQIDVTPGDYTIIVATGVVSLGAAPPEMLDTLLMALAPAGLLAFSYNDPTLKNESYVNALEDILQSQKAEVLFREHGPHLSAQVTGSDVIVLRRR
ncbi:class I SAM-dependent DNA methyltransferase [Pseudooctadecabacter sp.]|uniref:class I SAM-dependent DNA methyltransferase n=1 Tax=Pseudooctadecabacter sp. TaxID=1966338 RepID=UPI0035C7FB6C